MSASAPRRTRKTPRRTQKERSATTRARVLRAASESLAERGFRETTLGEVAKRAGVTWGAMQHQFGDKDAILDAVQSEALRTVEEKVGHLRAAEPDPARRVAAFVGVCRELLGGPDYRAFVEIQLARRRSGKAEADWGGLVGRSLARAFRRAFGDLELPASRLTAARRFAFVMLSGE